MFLLETSFGSFVLLILAVMVIVLGYKGIVLVRQAEVMIIERLGSYYKTLDSGLHFIIPMIDQNRRIVWRYVENDMLTRRQVVRIREIDRIDLREAVYDFPRQNVITRDNVGIEISALLYFQITDPKKAVYEIANLPEAIEKLTQTTLRNVIGEMDLDQTLSSRETINNKLRLILDEATDKWGVKVHRVELQDINPPDEIRVAMEKQMNAERTKRANILEAEGFKRAAVLKAEGVRDATVAEAEGTRQKQILEAEGKRQQQILLAEGQAVAIRNVADAESNAIDFIKRAIGDKTNPVSYLVAIKYIEAFTKMCTEGKNKTIFLPFEASTLLSSLGSVKEIFSSINLNPDVAPAAAKLSQNPSMETGKK
ncbi:MAG: SPFH/Band 7/PHB domain protein [Candidatus Wallbacteria bacterium]|nr:SPFH/Band 7/PHB domain protein [Candidatus Wallbacteria bacterium]